MSTPVLHPWQQQPQRETWAWSIEGGRATGKTYALMRMLIDRARNGEECAFVAKSHGPLGSALRTLVDILTLQYELTPDVDFQVSNFGSSIHFEGGGVIQLYRELAPGSSPRETTLANDDPERPYFLVAFRKLKRYAATKQADDPYEPPRSVVADWDAP